jgi:hypothetical protein
MREARRVSDLTQKSEAPEPERTPAVALEPAPAIPAGGLALGQLGSVDAVLALSQSSGNQAVDRVLRGQAETGDALLSGALGAALAAVRPSAKPVPRKRAGTGAGTGAGTSGRRVADDVGPQLRAAAASRLASEARTAKSLQAPFAVEAGAVTVTAGGGSGGFAGAGFVDPAGLQGGVASFGGPARAAAGSRMAADGGAGVGDDAEEGSINDLVGTKGLDSGAGDAGAPGDDETDYEVPEDGDGDAGADGDAGDDGDGEVDSGGRFDPGGSDQLIRLRARARVGARALDRFAEENMGVSVWADLSVGSDADRAASEATRESWARRYGGQAPAQRPTAQLPEPSVNDAAERRRQVEAFRMTGAGEAAVAERRLVATPIDEIDAARARNDAARAQLLAWTSELRDTSDT